MRLHKTIFGLTSEISACLYPASVQGILTHSAEYFLVTHAEQSLLKQSYILKTLSSILPRIAGFYCKIAALSLLYANEKNSFYYPDYFSGLLCALLRFFLTIFLEIAIT